MKLIFALGYLMGVMNEGDENKENLRSLATTLFFYIITDGFTKLKTKTYFKY